MGRWMFGLKALKVTKSTFSPSVENVPGHSFFQAAKRCARYD